MAANLALYVVPVAIARTREKLDDVLASWAEWRSRSEMAIRVSGPRALPGKDYEVWLFETTSRYIPLLLSDLALRARAVVALRLNCNVGRGIAQVHTRDTTYTHWTADRFEDLEGLVARALGAFEGPIDTTPGWLPSWLAQHEAEAEVRVVRWHNARTKTIDWPHGYGKPSEEEWRNFEGIYDDELNVLKAHC